MSFATLRNVPSVRTTLPEIPFLAEDDKGQLFIVNVKKGQAYYGVDLSNGGQTYIPNLGPRNVLKVGDQIVLTQES